MSPQTNKFLLTIYVAISFVALVHSGSAPAKTGSGAPGKQGEDCPCPYIYNPVCGANGITYPNQCVIDCAGVEVALEGQCPEFDGFLAVPITFHCDCDTNIALACGDDGNTYPNPCILECSGVGLDREGGC